MNARRGLGRGLGALIPPAPSGGERPSPVSSVLMGGDQSRTAGEEAADVDANSEPTTDDTADNTAGSSPDRTPDSTAGTAGGAGEQAPKHAGEHPEGEPPVAGAHFAELAVDAITPNARQPRQTFDEESMAELVHSLKEIGLLQPIVVRRLGDERYELVMGERRWRAAQLAELATIPAIIRETGDDAMLRDALLENLHRVQLNPLEEAAAYGQLLDDFGCTHDELAQRIGRSRPQITNTLRLLKLVPAVQRRVAAGVLSAGHARTLVGVENEEAQERLAHRVVAENLSVRALEELVTLGDDPAPAKPASKRTSKATAPKAEELAARLSDRFDTRVKIALGRTKGRITVEFGSLDDLERIVGMMDPSEARSTTERN